MIPDGLFPAVALAHGVGVLVVREGDSRAAGAVVAYTFDPARYAFDPTVPAALTEIWRAPLPPGSPCFPGVYLLDGVTWVAYHDGIQQWLRNLTTSAELAVDGLSNPTAFGAGCFAYTSPWAPYAVYRRDLRTGATDQPRLGAPTGLSRIADDGTVWTIDEDRLALAGATVPSFAGPLAVGEGPSGGAVWRHARGARGVLWSSLDGFTPKCAADGDTLAITTAGSGSVRLFCGTLDQLIAASPIPPPAPVAFAFTHPVLVAPFKAEGSGAPDLFSLGLYTEDADPHDDLLDAAGRGERLFLGHDAPSDWTLPVGLRPWDIPLLECYRVPQETLPASVARWTRQLQQLVAQWPGVVGVIPMWYTQDRWTIAVQPAQRHHRPSRAAGGVRGAPRGGAWWRRAAADRNAARAATATGSDPPAGPDAGARSVPRAPRRLPHVQRLYRSDQTPARSQGPEGRVGGRHRARESQRHRRLDSAGWHGAGAAGRRRRRVRALQDLGQRRHVSAGAGEVLHLRLCRGRRAVSWPLLQAGDGVAGPTGPRGAIAGRLSVVDGRVANDAGFTGIYAISEFSAAHLCRTGHEGEIVRRFERAAAARRNVARFFMMARNLFDLAPSQPGYWDAQTRAVTLAAAHGLYAEPVLFADAQDVLPNPADRRALVKDYAAWCRAHVSVLPALTNEPTYNGWSGATDPALLELADLFAAEYGSRDFVIGDPPDVTTVEGGDPLRGALVTLAGHSRLLSVHDDRTEDASRFARWVDHLKGFGDFRDQVKGCALYHGEPMGMASVRDVPLANGRTYRREDRGDALVAATCIAAITQPGFCTRYISEQDDTIPGLEDSAIAADIPQTPDWRFINAALGGSPVTGFTGFEKVRPSTNGSQAWACAYGLQRGSITWARGFTPERVYQSDHVEIWKATR